MMRYAIRHVTRFEYADAAGFARCNLRLEPIAWPGQSLEEYALSVTPHGSLRGVGGPGRGTVTPLTVAGGQIDARAADGSTIRFPLHRITSVTLEP